MARTKGIDQQAVVDSIFETQSIEQTSLNLGISETTVRYHLKQAGIIKQYQFVELSVADCMDAFMRYRDIDQTADALGVAPSYVQGKINEGFLEQCQ